MCAARHRVFFLIFLQLGHPSMVPMVVILNTARVCVWGVTLSPAAIHSVTIIAVINYTLHDS